MGNRPAQHANPPLSGINVLDLTNVISGPYCCFHLGLMGAAVLKVEQPAGGDMGRRLGAGAELKELDMGSLFLAQNAGKRSMTLNLKHPRGRDVFLRLARQADVLVENFRPGVMSRLGLDYETLREHNAGLVYCSISGFGQESPLKDNPAFDQIVQGLSGAMGTTGTVASGPLRAGYPISDTVGGLNAAFAISSALLAREKARSGGDTG
ncbi:MAG: CoA transferase, partial [Deltaproteobacteria bacterium]|nr:CoA transferase [Deltaproteobacteria bacterium]